MAYNDNRITDNQASVETDLTGFDFINCSNARSTAQALHGSASLLATQNPATTYYGPLVIISGALLDELNTYDGQTWTMYGAVKAGAASSTEARIWLSTNLGNLENNGNNVSINTSGWTEIARTVTLPSSTMTTCYIFGAVFDASGTGTAYWDKFGLWSGTDTEWSLPSYEPPTFTPATVRGTLN